jgi:hypothetical protein
MDNFKNRNELIMNFWNDDITFVTQSNWKMWTQKICLINKIKIFFQYNIFLFNF